MTFPFDFKLDASRTVHWFAACSFDITPPRRVDNHTMIPCNIFSYYCLSGSCVWKNSKFKFSAFVRRDHHICHRSFFIIIIGLDLSIPNDTNSCGWIIPIQNLGTISSSRIFTNPFNMTTFTTVSTIKILGLAITFANGFLTATMLARARAWLIRWSISLWLRTWLWSWSRLPTVFPFSLVIWHFVARWRIQIFLNIIGGFICSCDFD